MDLYHARNMAREARRNLNYAISANTYLGKIDYSIYDMMNKLNEVEPSLYAAHRSFSQRNELGLLQVPMIAWIGLTAAITWVSTIWQKSWTARSQAEAQITQSQCELKKLELVGQGVLSPEDLTCGSTVEKDTVGNILEKIRSIVLIGVGAASLIAILGFFKKK